VEKLRLGGGRRPDDEAGQVGRNQAVRKATTTIRGAKKKRAGRRQRRGRRARKG
jgi:hypothetical protein